MGPAAAPAPATPLAEAVFRASGLEVTAPEALSAEELLLYAVGAKQKGDLEAAAVLFEAAGARAPATSAWLYRRALADCLVGLRRDREAVAIYEDLVAQGEHPSDAQLHGNLAFARYRLGETVAARSAAREALALEPGNAAATKTLGLVELREGHRERGAQYLRSALEADPRLFEAQAALAKLEADAGRTEDALERYRSLLKLAPEARAADLHRRWRDLFYPSARPTEAELKLRINELEARLEKERTERKEQERP